MDGREEMRAADTDREAVAQRLRSALDEGRLRLDEYDERLQQAYAARTYGELDTLLADLPQPVPAQRSGLAPLPGAPLPSMPPAGRLKPPVGPWLVSLWSSYLQVVAVTVAVWGVICVLSGELIYFWPIWVAGPWGAVLLVQTVGGVASGEPARWAAKRRKRANRG